jgi:hypothetical protein
MKRKNGKPQLSGKLFGLLTRNERRVELPVAELEPAAYPQHIYLRGWLGENYVACIVPVDRVTVYAK